MVVQVWVGCPMETTVCRAEDVFVGGEEDGVVIGDEAFGVARGEAVVAKLPVEALVAADQNATTCGGIVQAVGAEDAPDVTPLRAAHGVPLRFCPAEE